ncbi:MAG: TraB/GumN family protein [Acidobacteriota bacterium]
MSNRLISLVGASMLVFSLISLSTLPSEAQDKPAANKQHFLWKIKTAKNTVYLLGSIHLLKKEHYPLPDVMEKAYLDSQTVVLELQLDQATQQSIQQLALAKGIYASDKSLQSTISQNTYDLTKKRAAELGLNIATLAQLKPWLIALTLTSLKFQRMGLEPQYGVDMHFMGKAKQDSKEIVSFETAEYQINRFAELADNSQESLLLSTLKDLDNVDSSFNKIVDSWLNGNEKGLEDLLLGSLKTNPEVYDRLIIERNRNWLPQIEGYLQQSKNYLVIVGAAHLVGDNGVINLLKKKGFSIEQL